MDAAWRDNIGGQRQSTRRAMLRTRLELEEIEARTLAPYAMRSRDSRGRRVDEPEHPLRTAFQRDRDRVIHSAAFRRLEYKTQVFVNHEGDYYRTRLTHTMEAAQITRTVARALGLNEELAEAVALSHDLGHPPFGHAGEHVLNDRMRAHGGFDHNAQSLRTVDWIEVRYPNFRGLNLTFEVREGIIKHSSFAARPAAQEFDPKLFPCLEAQIVDLADEIAYLAHDTDDGVRAQMLTLDDLNRSSLFREAAGAVKSAGQKLDSRLERYQTVIRMIDTMVTDLAQNLNATLEDSRVGSVDDVRQAGRALAQFSPPRAEQVRELKRIMTERLYSHYRVRRMTEKAGRVLAALFDTYMGEPGQMPPHVLARIESDGEATARVVADYIAGMTDRFALDEYRKLFDPDERV
ncbi:MAG TPA: deoxyguanosinetriphosphate triphosphohydrolase [Candidatus Binataceae bacterium]|nr:deoxyguanosinetriphosphate triphosphohydrolase [Candidatus Binataceae bacterium]